MTSQLIREALSRPEIQVVGEFRGHGALASAEHAAHVDVAILGSDSAELSPEGLYLLRASPSLKVLAVVAHGNQGYLHELRPHRTSLGEISSATLLTAVAGTEVDP